MTITALPTPPLRSDPTSFASRGDAFLAALPTFAEEANALAAAMNLNSTTDASASGVLIGTGVKTFTVTAGKSFQPGMYLVIADAAAPSANSMWGQITSYSGTSLVVNIIAVRGSGTKTSWVISQSAPGGAAAGENTDITSISGNAATATKLATACTIGGVSFDGSANINLPGVNTAGNQNTSGNAATATKLATARTIGGVSFDGTANINLPGVNITGNQNTTGNAATATTAASCSGNAATASAAKDGYFTALSSYPRLEINQPGVTAGQWAINASANYVFEETYGNGVAAATLLTLTRSGSLSTPGGYSGNAATATKLVNDTGAAPSYSCRAWVNFNGTGTVSIRASGNVSSITDNGVGDYTINFITSMPDVNYSAVLSASLQNTGAIESIISCTRESSTTLVSSLRINTAAPLAQKDPVDVNLAIFR